MNENVVVHLMLLKLQKILPPENWRFIEQEGQKLLKAFKHIYTLDWENGIEKLATGDCIVQYNQWRPITTLTDTILIKVICQFITDGIPMVEGHLFKCLERGTLVIHDDWRIDLSKDEEERQKSLPDYGGWVSYGEAFKQSERMNQPDSDPQSNQCPSEH